MFLLTVYHFHSVNFSTVYNRNLKRYWLSIPEILSLFAIFNQHLSVTTQRFTCRFFCPFYARYRDQGFLQQGQVKQEIEIIGELNDSAPCMPVGTAACNAGGSAGVDIGRCGSVWTE